MQEKGGDEALKLFKKAVENAKPLLEVKSRRVGGANYQVPVEVNAGPAYFAGDSLADHLFPRTRRKRAWSTS